MIAKGVKIPDSTNLIVKVIAIREDLQFCLKNLPHMIIETDS